MALSWECSHCGKKEPDDGVVIDAVCHHCGRPLCSKDRIAIDDEVFDSRAVPRAAVAFHCEECRKRFHPYTFSLG
jgi:uncharacterized protein with PIN domain